MKMTCGKGGKWGEVSPTFDGFWNENQKGRKEKEKERRREGKQIEKMKKIEEIKNFPAFGRSKLDGLRIKVIPRNERYTWLPKSGSFVKLQEVRNLPTRVISSLKVI